MIDEAICGEHKLVILPAHSRLFYKPKFIFWMKQESTKFILDSLR